MGRPILSLSFSLHTLPRPYHLSFSFPDPSSCVKLLSLSLYTRLPLRILLAGHCKVGDLLLLLLLFLFLLFLLSLTADSCIFDSRGELDDVWWWMISSRTGLPEFSARFENKRDKCLEEESRETKQELVFNIYTTYIYIYIRSLFIVAKLVAGMRKENGERMVGDVVNGGTTH